MVILLHDQKQQQFVELRKERVRHNYNAVLLYIASLIMPK